MKGYLSLFEANISANQNCQYIFYQRAITLRFFNMEGTKMSDLVYDTEFLIIAIKISYVESQECPIHLDLGK